MSEYQYYEFQAIDRPLTLEEQQAVARLSSRVDPHPWRAVFTYSYSDFPGDPKKVLARYYDVLLYMANWGSYRLMFRFPKAPVELDRMRQYTVKTLGYPSDAITCSTVGEYAILDIQFHDEEGGGWIEGEGWLGSLIRLRDDILRRDYRLLYLAWLKGLTLEDTDEDALEPPVPPGLHTLTPALRDFVELFEMDADLIQVAAERSGEPQVVSDDDLHRAIAKLSPEERDAFLLRLAKGEPHLSLALNRRLGALTDVSRHNTPPLRTVSELFAIAEELAERRRKEQAAKAEAKRFAELEALARRGDDAWNEVDALIQKSQAKPYDEAAQLLVRLRDVAEYKGQQAAFQERLNQIYARYSRRYSLIERLRNVGLYEQ